MPHRYSHSTTQLGDGPTSELKPALTEKTKKQKTQEHFGRGRLETKCFMLEGLERGSLLGCTPGKGRGKPVQGRGAAMHGKHKKILVAPKGALELSPK